MQNNSLNQIKRFRVFYKNPYAPDGYSFEIFESKDVFTLSKTLEREWKRYFKMPFKIEEVEGAQ